MRRILVDQRLVSSSAIYSVDARHGPVRFAPGLAALFESCVVQQPLTFQDRFEPTMLLTLRPQPILVSQEHAHAPYAAASEHIVNIAAYSE
jgi:hypothetical protein